MFDENKQITAAHRPNTARVSCDWKRTRELLKTGMDTRQPGNAMEEKWRILDDGLTEDPGMSPFPKRLEWFRKGLKCLPESWFRERLELSLAIFGVPFAGSA